VDMQDIKAIAEGRQPKPWVYTATHPVYGELTFRAELPRVRQLTEHSKERDNLLAGLDTEPGMNTLILCSAIAALKTLIQVPVIREERVEDEDDPAHVKITKVYYDAEAEYSEAFLADVWIAYANWRASFLEPQATDALGESSGETGGDDSSEPSNGISDSPSTTPDSMIGPTPTTSVR
jgi:hypothetical protein